MTTTFREKRRARRIASDEAHAWARNLRLNNSQAKLTLSMLTLYVDGEGCCFVSVPQLSEDTELSPQTVRRRLAWLEQIGAIARIAQWVDEQGRRNGEGRGRRTSDLIRLLLDADPDAVEAMARDGGDEFSPSSQQGLNSRVVENSAEVSTAPADPSPQIGSDEAVSPSSQQGLNGADPALPLRRPYHCGKGLISEPEPESPPKPPQGGEREDLQASEPEDFAPAWNAYPGHEVMRRDLALIEFRQLPKDKQRLCRAAVPLFAAALAKNGRTKPPNFHLWIRNGGFEEFPQARLSEEKPAVPSRRFVQGAELDGMIVAVRIAEQRDPPVVADHELGQGIWTTREAQKDLPAMAKFVGEKRSTWQVVEQGTPQFAAWRDRLALWLGRPPQAYRIWLEPYDEQVHGAPTSHPNFRIRKSTAGLQVPTPWPPHRDGSWPQDQNEGAA